MIYYLHGFAKYLRVPVLLSMPIHLPPTNDFHNLAAQEERYRDLLKQFSNNDAQTLEKAYRHAKKAHGSQMRDDGTPYILHPLRAAISLMSECGVQESDILVAMLFHDVIEDTPLTDDHIARDFGEEVARLVQNVTRPRPTVEDEVAIRCDKAQKFMALMEADEKTRLIKCADVLDNVRSWPNIPCGSAAQKKLPRWHEEIATYALPLAERTHPALFEELSKAFAFSQDHKNLCVPIHT